MTTEQQSSPAREEAGTLSFIQAVALVMGSIIGVGIFSLPTALGALGPISLAGMLLTTAGALVLASLFATLARRLPADGGPYAYGRAAFGDGVGFMSAWAYWITTWAGLAAIAVGWEEYLGVLANPNGNHTITVVLTLVGLWVPALINLLGVAGMAVVQVWTTVIKFSALAAVSIIGFFFISPDNFTPVNTSDSSNWSAIGGAVALCLFSYLGVETASVAAAKVRQPERNVPRATYAATIATALVYMLSLTTVFGILGSDALAASDAPFSDAANAITGGTWGGNLMAAAVIVSGFGALNGWTLIAAEMPYAAAVDGVFPERFARLSRRGVPSFGIICSSALASVAVIINFEISGGATVFTTLVYMTGITYAVPYVTSALAQIKWRLADKRVGNRLHFWRDIILAVLTLGFSALCVWFSRNSGESALVVWGPFILAGASLLLGVPVYFHQRARNARQATRPA